MVCLDCGWIGFGFALLVVALRACWGRCSATVELLGVRVNGISLFYSNLAKIEAIFFGYCPPPRHFSCPACMLTSFQFH